MSKPKPLRVRSGRMRVRFGMRGRKIVRIVRDGWYVVAYDKRGQGYVGMWVKDA